MSNLTSSTVLEITTTFYAMTIQNGRDQVSLRLWSKTKVRTEFALTLV